MQYIPPNCGTLYRVIASLSPVYRYTTLLLCCVLVLYCWLRVVYSPVEAIIKRYTVMLEQLHKKQDSYRQSRLRTADMRGEIKNLHGVLTKNGAIPPGECTAAQHMIQAVEKAHAVGLQLISCAQDMQQEESWAYRQRLRFVVEGTLAQLYSFAKGLDAACVIGCDSLVLQRASNDVFSCTCLFDFYTPKTCVQKKTLQLDKAEGLGG